MAHPRVIGTSSFADVTADGAAEAPRPASPSARPKDVVDSYLRQLYGGNTPTRVLAAQGLGALPSFLPRSQAPHALRLAVELGVVSSLADVMWEDEQLVVQEACLMGLASLLLATAPYEEHSAPLRPTHLKQLAACLVQPQMLTQMGYVLTVTTSSRVVMAAARVVTIMAPYFTQSNDIYILDSRTIPALLAATAAVAAPLSSSSPPPALDSRAAPAATAAPATPRDAAACALALMALAQATPDLYVAIRTTEFLQAVSKLYERCILPDQPAGVFLPSDAAALLLRAVQLEPNPRWAASLPKGFHRVLERQLEESDALECLVSYVAVEGGNLRRLGEDVAGVAADNARAVMEKNGRELDHLKAQQAERQQQLTEARDAARDARRAVEVAEAEAAAAQEAFEAANSVVRAARNGGTPEQRRARREAEAAVVRAEGEASERREALAAAEKAAAGLREEVAALRRAAGPVRWQSDRMAKLEEEARAWRERWGVKGRGKVRVTRPNTAKLTEVLAYLARLVTMPPVIERGAAGRGGAAPVLPAGAPSPEHVAALQAKLLAAGLVQALLQLFKILSAVRSLAGELAALAADLALQPDMAAALGGAAEVLGREAAALGTVNTRAELRLKQVNAEAYKLRKALKLGFPEADGSPARQLVELGSGNGMSREVRKKDVEARLKSLEEESVELSTVLAESKGLVEMMESKLESVTEAASTLADSNAKFIKAFPSQAAPATPAMAPTASSPAAAMSIASHHIVAKDPSHPAGHLLGLLARALAPLSRAPQQGSASSNLEALVRQLQGRPPDGGGATWPPPPPPLMRQLSASDGGVAGGSASGGSNGRTRSAGGAGRPASARGAAGRGGGGSSGDPPRRPGSAGAISRERSAASSPRGSGGYGTGFGYSRYGGGFGGFNGFQGAGPFPIDAVGRPMRYPQESMYGIIQATHSPLRGYSSPSNGPRYALLLREKAALRSSAGAGSGGGGGMRTSRTSTGGGGGLRNSLNSALTADDRTTFSGPGVALSISMPLVEESRRVVDQVASSLLFDVVDPDVLGPGVVLRASAASAAAFGGGAFGSRLPTAHGTSSAGTVAAAAPPPVAEVSVAAPSPSSPATNATTAYGGSGGAEISVLDALLMQTTFLCDVLNALAAIQTFARTTSRTCRQLPASVSFASMQPGSLGIYMAQLHGVWAEAIAHHPEMRVQVTGAVTEIAELALVPVRDYQSVYKDTRIVEVLVQMLAGQLRPGVKAAASGAAPGSPKALPSNADGGAGPGPGADGGLKPRHVGRLSATAPPTLRLGAAQQAEQEAAAQALRAISHAQAEVLASIGQDEKLLSKLSLLVLDHSMGWTARLAASELLADLVLGGGPAAEAAVAGGAYAALVEVLNRDMYPFLNQDPRGSKESVVSALACMVSHPELLEGVVAAAQAPSGPSAGMPLESPEQVMTAILRSLWGICHQAYTLYTSDLTGHGRYVDPDLVSGLMSTAVTAARELAVLADTTADARLRMNGELKFKRKLCLEFLQAIKNASLLEALLELKKNLS